MRLKARYEEKKGRNKQRKAREREKKREENTIRFINGCILLAHLPQADDCCFCYLYASLIVCLDIRFGRLVDGHTDQITFKAYKIHTFPPPIAVPSQIHPTKQMTLFLLLITNR